MASQALRKITSKIDLYFPCLQTNDASDGPGTQGQPAAALSTPKLSNALRRADDLTQVSQLTEEALATPDSVFNSKDILSLNNDNFREFIRSKDVTMVLFYTPSDLRTTPIKQEFITAALHTKRRNHAYASVDCTQNGPLCEAHKAKDTPVLSLYTLGNKVGSIRDTHVAASTLKRYMEEIPVLSTQSASLA